MKARLPLPLTSFFEQHAGAADAGNPDLETQLAALVAKAAAAHPQVTLARETFVAHLSASLRSAADPAAGLATLHIADLYLACACVAGDAAALTIFDAAHLQRVSSYVKRVSSSPDFVADVLQTMRIKLLVARDGQPPALASYGGRAPLDAWLRVAAVRTARTMIMNDARYTTLRTSDGERPQSGQRERTNAELAMLKEEGANELTRALDRTLSELDDRDRVLLRLYFVEGMSLAVLGRIYHVHESTMMRRVHALRERLLDEVKKELGVDSRALAKEMALVESRLDLHLTERLRARPPD